MEKQEPRKLRQDLNKEQKENAERIVAEGRARRAWRMIETQALAERQRRLHRQRVEFHQRYKIRRGLAKLAAQAPPPQLEATPPLVDLATITAEASQAIVERIEHPELNIVAGLRKRTSDLEVALAKEATERARLEVLVCKLELGLHQAGVRAGTLDPNPSALAMN